MAVQYKFYDTHGSETHDLESDVDHFVVAKSHEFLNGIDYFILVNQRLLPYNTTQKDYINQSKNIAKVKSTELFKFVKVKKTSFDFYIKYLQTQNPVYLEKVSV